ncbi:MAG: MurR/RpiR family transcriptional regulator [Clostridiaceae bacterium]|nr:MurR/RpiR family transcriptional regulator [Clostridiaceae bacterium]
MGERNDCLVEIRSLYPSMSEVEKKIADFILENHEDVVHMTVAQLSDKAGVAGSSIIRFCNKLGFKGFSALRINLAKNLARPVDLIYEDIQEGDDTRTVTSKVFKSSIQTLIDTVKTLDINEMERAVDALLKAKRIEFYGVGTSATIASDAYYRLMRIGLPAFIATDPHISKVSASMLDKECVAFGISHTGRTKDTVRALQIAREKGAKTICITSFNKSPITGYSDIKLVTSAAETQFMREAVSSRIAQIAVLDSLYVCIAIRRFDSVIEKVGNMSEILNEMRL